MKGAHHDDNPILSPEFNSSRSEMNIVWDNDIDANVHVGKHSTSHPIQLHAHNRFYSMPRIQHACSPARCASPATMKRSKESTESRLKVETTSNRLATQCQERTLNARKPVYVIGDFPWDRLADGFAIAGGVIVIVPMGACRAARRFDLLALYARWINSSSGIVGGDDGTCSGLTECNNVSGSRWLARLRNATWRCQYASSIATLFPSSSLILSFLLEKTRWLS
jgi:hypothetical protein